MRKVSNGSGKEPGKGIARGRSRGADRKGSGEAGLVVLPAARKEEDHPCFDCAKCCHYVAIEIDRPTTNREFDYLVWYLHHPGISVFVDWDGHWFVNFASRCDQLTEHGLCGIYDTRPGICRDFDWQECEMHVKDDPPDKWLFETVDQFLGWLERQRPKAFARFRLWQRERAREKPKGRLARVRVTQLSLER